MKKTYLPPFAEVVKFEYKDQVVAVSGGCSIVKLNVHELSSLGCCTNPSYSPNK